MECSSGILPYDSFTVAIHGGAGVISKSIDGKPYKTALIRILKDIYQYFTSLQSQSLTFNVIDIVEYATVLLEEEPLFNAGKGSVYCSNGLHPKQYYAVLSSARPSNTCTCPPKLDK